MHRFLAIGTLWVSAAGVVSSTAGSTAPPFQQQNEWMLEIDNGGSPQQGDMQRHDRFFIHPLPLDPKNPPSPKLYNQWFVQFEKNGTDNFLFRFFFIPQGFDRPVTPERFDQLEKILIREFQMQPLEQVYLVEMREYGYRPVALRLVEPMGDRMPLPAVRIETPSLDLVGLRRVRNQLELTLANRSRSAVLSIQFQPGFCYSEIHAPMGRRLIAAKGEQRLPCGPPAASLGPSEIVVQSALFEDYSYEGDPRFARRALARLSGIHRAVPVLLQAVRNALEADREEEIAAVLQGLLEKLKPDKVEIPEALAEEFAELDGNQDGKDEWLRQLRLGVSEVFRRFVDPMTWNTQRLLDQGRPPVEFWSMLERQEEKLSAYLAWLDANPPGPRY